MLKNKLMQMAPKNSRGAAQTTTRKVNVICIDLTESTNKVEDFRKRVESSASNINKFPEAEILIDYRKWKSLYGERCTIDKLCLLQSENTITLVEGDKRKRGANRHHEVKLGDFKNDKSRFLADNAERIIVAMHCFWTREKGYEATLGVSLTQFNKHYRVLFPLAAKKVLLNDAISMATEEVMDYVKSSIKEGESIDGANIIRKTGWGVACEYVDGRMDGISWGCVGYFLPFKQELDSNFYTIAIDGHKKTSTTITLQGEKINASLEQSEDKKNVVLTVGEMSSTFFAEDYAGMYRWVYDNQSEITKPKYVSYEGLYGTDKVNDVVSIAKDILTVGVEFIRDNKVYRVVFCNEVGVTFVENTPTITGSATFQNNHLVSFDWGDFGNWNHMPTDDMCTIDKKWLVKDGVASLVEEPVSDNALSKAA